MKSILSISRVTVGLAVAIFCLAMGAQGQTFTILATFVGNDGAQPDAALAQGTDGNFYGTAQVGGADDEGTVFEITPQGELSNVYNFCSLAGCADGFAPVSTLVLGSDGDFYGTTSYSGDGGESGTVFKMALGGKLTTLYNYCESSQCQGADGYFPNGVIRTTNGSLVGTTLWGGTNNSGTIFEINPAGDFNVLYRFCSQGNCTDGAHPYFPPIQGRNGNFYGTATSGGANNEGVIYEITPGGAYTVLYSFCPSAKCRDGAAPNALVQDASGNFYGTANSGGASCGTIFKLTAANEFVLLHAFNGSDGCLPLAGLTQANDGNFYGTTTTGYTVNSGGNIFEITPQGKFTVLSNVCIESCVSSPNALFQATNGMLYGTTRYGNNNGTVFSFNNNLSPLVETVPTMGKVGTRVIVLGDSLTGSTSVTFNGVPAAFTVVSDTYISATVPAGATSGTVSVVTPAGVLNSNPRFVVVK